MMPSAPSWSCLQMKTTLLWKRSSGIDGAATRKRPTRVAAGVLDPGMFKVSSKSMGIVRAKIKGTKGLASQQKDRNRPSVLGSARLTATSEDTNKDQEKQKRPQNNTEDDGPRWAQSNDNGG